MKKNIGFFIGLLFIFSSYGQNIISYNGSGNFELVERTDLRRYDNGRYTGLVSREISSFIIPIGIDDGYLYDGSFYIYENTKRNMRKAAIGIDEAIPTVFKIDRSGHLTMIEDNGFPSYRSFPTYPDSKITVGSSWEGKAERAVDPLNKGIITKMPVYVQYTYTGDSVFYEEPVYVISAKWATRYGIGTGAYYRDWGGDQELDRATGSHNATIYVSKKSGNAVLIRDNVDETFFYADGNKIQFKGTISQFTKYPPAIDRTKILPILKRVANLSDDQVKELEKPVANYNESFTNESTLLASNDKNLESAITDNYSDVQNDSMEWEQVTDEAKSTIDSDISNKSDMDWEQINNKFNDINTSSAYNKNNNSNNDKEINIKVDNTVAGIRLTLENLQFLPDSANLVPGQIGKLNEIAEVLRTVPNGRFLIEGHTASTGYEKGEMKLSLERAQAMAEEFTSRGLEIGQFICKGSGGKKPVADNNTAEGKAKNRRVEITILE